MLVSEVGKFGDSNTGTDLVPLGDPGAPIHSSSFTEVKEEDLLKEFAAGRLNESNNSGTLLDKVARKSNAKTLLEQVKFYFYYLDGHIKVLAADIDQEAELRGAGKKSNNNIFSTNTD